MFTFIMFVVAFFYLAIIWVVVLAIYYVFLEPFDFAPLGSFVGKSIALILIVALFTAVVPYGNYATLIIWWIGLTLIFKKDFWECKILVILIWGISFLVWLGVKALLASFERSPISTV